MNKKSCPQCRSSNTKKNGTRKGVQLYKCLSCKHQFRGGNIEHSIDLWETYQNHKQTIQQLATLNHISTSTVKRKLRHLERTWQQPSLTEQSWCVHLDVTYWGYNWGILLAPDDITGKPLYLAFVKSETTKDFDQITAAGYTIKGLIVDGKKALFTEFREYPMQMCQFHVVQIVRRYFNKQSENESVCRVNASNAGNEAHVQRSIWGTIYRMERVVRWVLKQAY